MFRGEQEWVGTAYPGMSRVGGRALSLQSSPGGRPSWPGQPCSCPLCSPLTGGAPAPHCGPAPARRDLGSSAPCHVERSTCLSRREAWQRGIVVWASRKSDSWEDYLETSISKKKKKRNFIPTTNGGCLADFSLTPPTELIGTVFRHCRCWPQPETWTFSFSLVQPHADGWPPGLLSEGLACGIIWKRKRHNLLPLLMKNDHFIVLSQCIFTLASMWPNYSCIIKKCAWKILPGLLKKSMLFIIFNSSSFLEHLLSRVIEKAF